MNIIRTYGAIALASLSVGACATKGYVRQQVMASADTTRAAWTASDAEMKRDMEGQFSRFRTDVDSVKADVAALRQDLASLRTEFGAKITAMENGMKFAFPVTFGYDDAAVRDQDRAALDRFAQIMNRHYAGSVITVEGFADPAGSASYNKALSEDRAESVVAYLNQAGLTGATLRAVGMGESRQVVNGASRDMPGAETNRRVVFVVESAGAPPSGVTRP